MFCKLGSLAEVDRFQKFISTLVIIHLVRTQIFPKNYHFLLCDMHT